MQVATQGFLRNALPWGNYGRKFKSCHSDQNSVEISRFLHYFFAFLSKFYILLRSKNEGVTQFVTQICGVPFFIHIFLYPHKSNLTRLHMLVRGDFMDFLELPTSTTTLANIISCNLTQSVITLVASILVQLGIL